MTVADFEHPALEPAVRDFDSAIHIDIIHGIIHDINTDSI